MFTYESTNTQRQLSKPQIHGRRNLSSVLLTLFILILTSCPLPGPDPRPPVVNPEVVSSPPSLVAPSANLVVTENREISPILIVNSGGKALSCDVVAGSTPSSNLTDGLRLAPSADGRSCRITGTPATDTSANSPYNISITASNSVGTSPPIAIELRVNPFLITIRASETSGTLSETITLTGSAVGAGTDATYAWTQRAGTTATIASASAAETRITLPANISGASETLSFRLSVSSGGKRAEADINITVFARRADADRNGLIEVGSIEELYNMRFNLEGTSYKTSATAPENRLGCPLRPAGTGTPTCSGYELTRDIDFDSSDDPDTTTWTRNANGTYALDTDDHIETYFPITSPSAANAGWVPIGTATAPFNAIFDGKGNTISNLLLRSDSIEDMAFFGITEGNAQIRNITLKNALVDSIGLVDFTSHALLVGRTEGNTLIVNSHASGIVDGTERTNTLGGLVGLVNSGKIVASSVNADIHAHGGSDIIGGLVGQLHLETSIIASFAQGNVYAGSGNMDLAGALVGSGSGTNLVPLNEHPLIVASYARGNVDGGAGRDDYTGGLMGIRIAGELRASYALGRVSGGDSLANMDSAGSLLSWFTSFTSTELSDAINHSYGFGLVSDANTSYGSAGSPLPAGVTTALDLTATNAGSSWDNASRLSKGAWDFGDSTQTPALRYADYDGTAGDQFHCDTATALAPTSIAVPNCGTLLPGQSDRSLPLRVSIAAFADANSAAAGELITLNGTAIGGGATKTHTWTQTAGTTVNIGSFANGNNSNATIALPARISGLSETYSFRLSVSSGTQTETADISITVYPRRADADRNGLIEVSSIVELYNMRFNRDGTSYKTSGALGAGNTLGCPLVPAGTGTPTCSGYELTRDIDFDSSDPADTDTTTWTRNADGTYSLDTDDHIETYFPISATDADSAGWLPIGVNTSPFNAIFDGKGNTISNLIVRSNTVQHYGLFGATGNNAQIKNITVENALVDSTSTATDPAQAFLGILVAQLGNRSNPNSPALVFNSHSSGIIDGAGTADFIGGLVGEIISNRIIASTSHAELYGRSGGDTVGGLIGRQSSFTTVIASFATGDSYAGNDDHDWAGGLIGVKNGSIVASYALGKAVAGTGSEGYAGGLIGFMLQGSLRASYSLGIANGGDSQSSNEDRAAALAVVPYTPALNDIFHSYGFGRVFDSNVDEGTAGSPLPAGVTTALDLTATNAGSSWDDASIFTKGAWDFGDSTQTPALRYADYDGEAGNQFHCDTATALAPTSIAVPNCGTLLPGQSDRSLPLSLGITLTAGSLPFDVDDTLTLTGNAMNAGASPSYSWTQVSGSSATIATPSTAETAITLPSSISGNSEWFVFRLTVTSNGESEFADYAIIIEKKVDKDGNGLIEVGSIEELYNMRFNLEGTSYKTSLTDPGRTNGCPLVSGTPTCSGYELTRDIDFDSSDPADPDTTTWTRNADGSYSFDTGDHIPTYFPIPSATAATAGWVPIGTTGNTQAFNATFDGKGFTIRNLLIQSELGYVGLFGATNANSVIRNLNLENILVRAGTRTRGSNYIATLVGEQAGTILNVHASGIVQTILDNLNFDFIGGLVGSAGANIIASSANVDVYATGGDSFVGGLVGEQFGTELTILASFATGNVFAGSNGGTEIGGLVGAAYGKIIASYTKGRVSAGAGSGDSIGGLVGNLISANNNLRASYTTSTVIGAESGDSRGKFIGKQDLSNPVSLPQNYAFGNVYSLGNLAEPVLPDEGSQNNAVPNEILTEADINATNAGNHWNNKDNLTLGAWNFGTQYQSPALTLADYDGDGSTYHCEGAANPPSNAIIISNCGTLLPGQDDRSVPLKIKTAPVPNGDNLMAGDTVTLSAQISGGIATRTITWTQTEGTSMATITPNANGSSAEVVLPGTIVGSSETLKITISVTSNGQTETSNFTLTIMP